jgi:hypothetical protein
MDMDMEIYEDMAVGVEVKINMGLDKDMNIDMEKALAWT